MKPLVSVIVPVYNVENYLRRCVNSLLAQTYSNLEIILVDDGSTDDSGHICDEYAKKDSRIRVIHKKNGGLSDARNTGIKIAKGELISFIDSDDWISPKMYEVLVPPFQNRSVDIVSGKFVETDGDEIATQDTNEVKVFTADEAFACHFKGQYFYHSVCNKLYRINLFSSVRFPFGKLAEDLHTTYKLIDRANHLVHIDSTIYYYFQRSTSIMHQPSKKLIIDVYEGAKSQYNYLKNRRPTLKSQLITSYINCCLKTYGYLLLTDKSSVYLQEIEEELKNLRDEKCEKSFLTDMILSLYFISPLFSAYLLKFSKKI